MIPLQRNPNAGQFVLPDGYKDVGWQVSIDQVREFDNSLHLCRGTDVVRICDVCKIVQHTDMSD